MRKKHLRGIQSTHVKCHQSRPRIPPITFIDDDFIALDATQDDPMVIIVEIDKFAISKVLVDHGSSVDILYRRTFRKMRIPESEIQPYEEQIVRFSGERVDTRGYIDLYTTFGEEGLAKTILATVANHHHPAYKITTKRDGEEGGNRGRSGLREDHRGRSANSYTTFLFSNFPNGYGEQDMFKVFQKWARVREVFISRRPNKWGRRFGFVRFLDVRNVGRLERELDQVYI